MNIQRSRMTFQKPEPLDCYAVHVNWVIKGLRFKGFVELDDEQAFSRERIIRDLIEGQHDNFDAVFCNGKDVSGEIAEEIVFKCMKDGLPIPESCRDFVHTHYGMDAPGISTDAA